MNTSTTMTKVTFDLFGPCHTFDRPINNLVLGLLDAHVNTEQRVIVIIVVVVVVGGEFNVFSTTLSVDADVVRCVATD